MSSSNQTGNQSQRLTGRRSIAPWRRNNVNHNWILIGRAEFKVVSKFINLKGHSFDIHRLYFRCFECAGSYSRWGRYLYYDSIVMLYSQIDELLYDIAVSFTDYCKTTRVRKFYPAWMGVIETCISVTSVIYDVSNCVIGCIQGCHWLSTLYRFINNWSCQYRW